MKKDIIETLTAVVHGMDPNVVEWYTHGRYRHDKHCPHWRAQGSRKACRCKHRHHHHYVPTGEGSGAMGGCSATAVDPEPTPTSGNSTVTTEETPSSSRSESLLQKDSEAGVAAPPPSEPSETAEPAVELSEKE